MAGTWPFWETTMPGRFSRLFPYHQIVKLRRSKRWFSPACAEESKSSAPSLVVALTLTPARPVVIGPEPRYIRQPTKGRWRLPPFFSRAVPIQQSGMHGIEARRSIGLNMRRVDDEVSPNKWRGY